MAKKKKQCKPKDTVVVAAAKGKSSCPQGQTWNGTKCVDDVGVKPS